MPPRQIYGMGQTMSREQIAQVAYQAGFRGQDLINFVGIAWRESAGNFQVRGTDSPPERLTGDFGLWGINAINDTPQARQAVGYTSRDQWLDPLVNAKMAFYLYQQAGMFPWRGSSSGWTAEGNWQHGVDLAAAATAVTNATNQGLLGQSPNVSQNGAAVPTQNGSTGAMGPMTLPPDAQLFNNGFTVIAVFDLGGVKIGYDVTWFDGSVRFDPNAVTHVSADQFNQMGVVLAGNAEELRDLSLSYGSYREFFDTIITTVMGANNPARNDPAVLAVLAQYAGRPDMTEAELQGLLRATPWYQQHTQGQLEWNSLSDAERRVRTDNMAARMIDTWFEFTGETVPITDPRIQNYVEQLASGATGYGAWTEGTVKAQATQNAESPWSRQVRQEQESQLQRGIDIENTAQRVRDLARRWGVQYADRQFTEWATSIQSNQMSEADVLELIKDQALVLYPWKDREMETTTAAAPWIQTYERVLEQTASLTNPQVQAALTAGTSAWEFEQQLKRSPGWLETRNARDELFSTVAEAGRRLGFE